jgi:DNA repair protein RadD
MLNEDVLLPILRTYQIDVRDRTREAARTCPLPVRVILQASTGAGKSEIGKDLILRCLLKGKRALFIVSGRALVLQFEQHLIRAGAHYGVIMSGRGRNNALIQIASKETLAARAIRLDRMELPPADLVVIDEAHESVSKEWRKLLDLYQQSVVIGLTATPALGNGKGLGDVYKRMERAVSTRQLVDEGWLVPCKVFAPETPNLKGVRTDSSGDYNRTQLAEHMDRPKITGNVLTNWRKHADGRKTVIFACTIDHAKHICQEFNAAGIPFRHVDQETEDTEREEIFGLIADGKIFGFTNVSVARRGLDLPCLEAACIVRPTKSLVLWLQMIGRIRRPSPGKSDCVIVDHAGACDYHCMPDDEIEWSLDPDRKVSDWLDGAKEEEKIPAKQVCPKCDCMFTGQVRCPNCGHTLKPKPTRTKQVEYQDGILVERGESAGPTLETMQRHWNKCVAIAVNRGTVLGVAVRIFSDQFGKKPWEVSGLKNMPESRDAWKQSAAEQFPNFKRVKVKG